MPIEPGVRMPRCSITDTRRKGVFAPLQSAAGASVRVAGFVELNGHDPSIPAERIRAGGGHARGDRDRGALAPWFGFRPGAPIGLRILGASPRKPLFVNVGHGTPGWTLAAGSARVVVDAILGRAAPIDTRAFQYR